MEHVVLVVDSSYRPMSISRWEDAMCDILLDRFQVLEYSDEVVNSAHHQWYLPEIIVSPKNSKFKKNVKFDYDSILSRDNYTCAYCGEKFKYNKLSVDHIIPRQKGGKDSWMNCITSCKTCNNKKANKSLEEAKMKLLFEPIEPKNTLEMFLFNVNIKPKWREYLPKSVLNYVDMLRDRTNVKK